MFRVSLTTAVICLLLVSCGPQGLLDPNAPGGSTTGTTVLTGRIDATQVSKLAPRSQQAVQPYTIVAQSSDTGEVYRVATGGEGDFELALPDAEAGNSFTVTILGPDGRAVGPVVFGEQGQDGVTAVAPDGATSLGTIGLPADPTQTPIEPGADADALDTLLDPNVTARLDAQGVPVGLATHGKGDSAMSDGGAGGGLVDADRDGLIDFLDADDDGDGIIDDVDSDADAGSPNADARFGCFMNLKISAELAPTYYEGTAAEILTRLATDTVITFEVVMEPGAARTVTAAELLETPGPMYLPTAEVVYDTDEGLKTASWAASGYALTYREDLGDRFDAFLQPNAVMAAGDTFTVEITYDDGSTEQQSRMLNYIFKNIPRLVQYGAAGSLSDFDVSDAAINGTGSFPIPFDGAQDLVLVFNPPLDENGAYLTGFDYDFAVFYQAADGTQLNGEIDFATTWPTPPAGFDNGTYRIAAGDLTLAPDNTYTVTLPEQVLPDTVTLQSGSTVAVTTYQIDITADCSSGNAAVLLVFERR